VPVVVPPVVLDVVEVCAIVTTDSKDKTTAIIDANIFFIFLAPR
jgi:hypothetical protein